MPTGALLLALASSLLAQSPAPSLTFDEANRRAQQRRWLSLRYAEIDTSRPLPAIPEALRAPEAAPGERRYWIVQMDGPHGEPLKADVQRTGLELLDYVPNYAFVARGTRAQLEAAKAVPGVAWVGDLHPAYRIDPELLGAAPTASGRFIVIAFAGVALGTLEAQVRAAGARVELADSSLLRWQVVVTGTVAQMQALARADDVQWLQVEHVATPRNDTMTWTVQTGVANDRKIWSQGLHGEDQVIGHMDGSISLTSCYFQDPVKPVGPTHRKIVYHSGTGADSHGSHTAGTAAGDAAPINSSTANRGLAWAARIAHTTGYPTSTFGATAGTHGTFGARVHTNSWGDDSGSTYDAFCAAVDAFSWNNEEHLVCFAITNGNRVVTHPDVAKNLLAVGSSGNGTSAGSTCFSGGYGPTLDGRRKPEVYTPGCAIVSASTATCGTVQMTGSSMACPSTTAAAALVRQYFMSGFYPTGLQIAADGFTPTGPLVKAMLVNSTQDMTGITGYPSAKEGWGRIVLDGGLAFVGDAERLFVVDVRKAEGLVTGKAYTYKLPVYSSSVPLRVTMAFHDAPGLASASNPVVNDVDLVLIEPDNLTTYYGNVLNTTTGWSQTGGVADAKNNVERVLIQAPAVGTWTLQVRGTYVPQQRQGFALCATGAIAPNPTFAANLLYGSGKAGSSGVPLIGGSSLPRVGNTEYRIDLAGALAGASSAWLFGFGQLALPFDGAALLVDPVDALALVVSATGTASVPLPLPDDPALCGASLYSQFWILNDPYAAGAHFACTAGLQSRAGN